jgi:protein SCO1/2
VNLFENKAVVFAAIIAMALGFFLSFSLDSPDPTVSVGIQGTVISPARKIMLPELVKDDGSALVKQDIRGHWTLVFFGYMNCPDICPTTLNVLAQAKRNTKQEFPKVIFVSVDPERDTIEKLGKYVRYFDPDFNAVTGTPEMIKALTLQMSVVFMKAPGASGEDEDYLVDHSSSIMLLNPKGRLQAFLGAPHTPQSILDSLNTIFDSSQFAVGSYQ